MRVLRMTVGRLVLAMAVMAVGCAQGERKSPTPVPFSGTVTLDDKPANLAMVKFVPTDTTKGFGGLAVSDKDGKFSLKPSGIAGDGVPPGTYKVVVSTFFLGEGYDPSSPDNPPGLKPPTPEQGAPTAIPGLYAAEETTPLSVTVGTTGGTESLALRSK